VTSISTQQYTVYVQTDMHTYIDTQMERTKNNNSICHFDDVQGNYIFVSFWIHSLLTSINFSLYSQTCPLLFELMIN